MSNYNKNQYTKINTKRDNAYINQFKWLSNDSMDPIMKCHLYIYIHMVQTPHEEGSLASKLGCATTLLPPPVTLETDIFHPTMAYYECKEWIMVFRGVWLFCYLSYVALHLFLFTLRGHALSGVATGCSSLHQKEQWCDIPYIADFLYNGVPWGKVLSFKFQWVVCYKLRAPANRFFFELWQWELLVYGCVYKVSELRLICTWSRS